MDCDCNEIISYFSYIQCCTDVAGEATGVDLGALEELQKRNGAVDHQGWGADYNDHFAEQYIG